MSVAAKLKSISGSPPRVRSRPEADRAVLWRQGITSACAEQTPSTGPNRWRVKDHLRVCGADRRDDHQRRAPPGSPPRVRSRLGLRIARRGLPGITSACAEQTNPVPPAPASAGDHLRVCGADLQTMKKEITRVGSPPRVRSRPLMIFIGVVLSGITSACAEQTRQGS